MYIVVHHAISNPAEFWTTAEQVAPNLPSGVTLHHTFPAEDGRTAICVWEAASIRELSDFLEPAVGHLSSNSYYQVPNKEGVVIPTVT